MQFRHLMYFLDKKKQDLDKSDTKDARQKYYIKLAYDAVKQKLAYHYKSDEIASKEKIDALPLTMYMKNQLKKMLQKKPPKPVAGRKLLKPAAKKKEEAPREDKKLQEKLMEIIGIGQDKARKLVDAGLKSVDDLVKNKYYSMLNKDTKVALSMKPDRVIPHEFICELSKFIDNPKFRTVIVGSFRRKKPYSKDIDLLICGDISEYIAWLRARGSATKGSDRGLKVVIYSLGKDKASVFIKFRSKVVKMDIFSATPGEYHAMMLYSTGSKQHNIKMRSRAKKMGYLLNQTGLYERGNTGDCDNPARGLRKIPIRSERGFFDILGLTYVEPEMRD